jgi:hypothetical protein
MGSSSKELPDVCATPRATRNTVPCVRNIVLQLPTCIIYSQNTVSTVRYASCATALFVVHAGM